MSEALAYFRLLFLFLCPGKSDPYVKFKLGSQKYKSKVSPTSTTCSPGRPLLWTPFLGEVVVHALVFGTGVHNHSCNLELSLLGRH